MWPQFSETRTGDLQWRHCHCSSSDTGPDDDTCTTVNYQDDNTDKHRPADGTDSDIENMAMGKLHERDALDDGDDRDDSTYAAVGNDINPANTEHARANAFVLQPTTTATTTTTVLQQGRVLTEDEVNLRPPTPAPGLPKLSVRKSHH